MKRMRKSVIYLLTIVMLVGLLLPGCAPAAQEAPPVEEEVFTVGINNFGQANFFARIGRDAMIEQIEANGGVVISTVTADVPSRMAAIENLIIQGVDAIILQEGDLNLVAPALLEAKEKGILIGSVDAGDADFVDFVASSDNVLLGTAAAEEMVRLMGGEGNIVEIFHEGGQMIRERRAGMHTVIANYPDIKIVAGFTYAWPDFFPDGKAKMEAILQANPNPGDIDAVFATFDGVGVAAATAIREFGLQDHIVVVGIDGDPEAYKEMQIPGSPFMATMAQDPDTIARLVVDNIFELLKGNTIPSRKVLVPGIQITKDNIPAQ